MSLSGLSVSGLPGFYIPTASAIEQCYRNVLPARDDLGCYQVIFQSLISLVEVKRAISWMLYIG